jgi:hypothetical protein
LKLELLYYFFFSNPLSQIPKAPKKFAGKPGDIDFIVAGVIANVKLSPSGIN